MLRAAASAFCSSLARLGDELNYLWQHPCWMHAPISLPLAALNWRARPLITAVLTVLCEHKLLLHATSLHLLLP